MTRMIALLAVASAVAVCAVPGVGARPGTQSAIRRAIAQPAPRTFSGTGSRVLTTRLSRRAPLVVTATHNGSANFVIKIVGGGANELLVNEIGHYSGQTVWDAAHSGRYRIAVEADGGWTIKLYQPVPSDAKRNLIGSFSGRGSRALFVKTTRSVQPVLTASHNGQANFVVRLIAYGNITGTILLVNEIGHYHGQTLLDQPVPRGTCVIAVEADGAWTLRFSP